MPPWWRDFAADATGAGGGTPDGPAKSYWLRGFSRVTAPFAREAAAELARRVPGASAAVVTAFAADLAGDLVSLAARVLVLELNVARVRGDLRGQDGPERFWSFIEAVNAPAGRRALFDEYPVLARLLAQRAGRAVATAAEFFERWHADRALLAVGGEVAAVRFGHGDLHQGGRSVAVAELSTGERIVYKPRPQAVHAAFNTLLEWLNATVAGLDLRTLRVVDRGTHGWVEFAERADCAGPADFDRYYRRLGALMAVLHATDAADIHFENLIAAGDQPVVVDLETLFHQRLPVPAGRLDADDPAARVLDASVVRLGVLPILVRGAEGTVDFGALGGDPAASLPFASATWQDDGTDTMRVVRRTVEFPGGQNRPSAGGSVANPLLHLPALIAGFRESYRAIEGNRAGFTARLESFAAVEVRMVLRPTQTYSTLLSEGNHPDVLRDALDFDRHLGLLWADCEQQPALAAIVPHELADLWAGDVPLFTTRPGSRDLWTSRGERLPSVFDAGGLDAARAKVAAFGDTDRRRQEWIIEAAMVTRPDAVALGGPPLSTVDASAVPPEGAYLAAARTIADRLAELAIEGPGERVNWLGLAPSGETGWQVRALGWDLYSGVAGVAVFLDTAGRLTGTASYRELAARAVLPVPRLLDELGRRTFTGSGLTGLPGLAYALLHLGRLDDAERAVALCGPLVDADDADDILAGRAGAIAALLAIGSDEALAIARRCGERLLESAKSIADTLAWSTLDGAALTGFSHGAAGIGWALIRLGDAVGDERFVAAGLAALRYERSLFQPSAGDWPDLRDGAAAIGPMTAWCHGAAGIGLARAGVLPIVDDPGLRDDLAAALARTVSHGFGHNHCLCHGDLGNAELLLATRDPRRDDVGRAVLARLGEHGPRCGTPLEVESPGLMTGLAGIGHGLLRLAAPDRTAALLLVQPPAHPA
ncbi:type 2 lanthipeptide synthetase LanM family protein [Dactylosporangium sp. CA-233914]|uniref:type 2 lanthipeptide synthetase LanM family protein n=1 Tax=Dactylosporangium sp. CA-233914 TaxID=3239934 RepID=UPI003D8C6FC2